MKRLFNLSIALLLTLCLVEASEKPAVSEPEAFVGWEGSWEVSKEANRLLGFATEETRADATWDHPTGFKISLHKTLGEGMDAQKFASMRALLKRQLGHEVVATGLWETEFLVEPGIEKECFVTRHAGKSYLLVGAPYVVFYGGKVSLISGVDVDRDLLAIDFNPLSTQRTADTVVYRRKKE